MDYTHIVRNQDAMVSHSGSASNWDLTKRHAAVKTAYNEYKTLCGKTLSIDNEDYFHADGAIAKEKASKFQGTITCKKCQKAIAK